MSELGRSSAISNDMCVVNHLYYYAWFISSCVFCLFRLISFVKMVRAQRFLTSRDADKHKKKLRKKAKLRKHNRIKRRMMAQKLNQIRNRLFIAQQKHLGEIILRNKRYMEEDESFERAQGG